MLSNKRPGVWWDLNLNLVYGCSPVSRGCDHCWAAAMAWDRKKGKPLGPYTGLVENVDGRPRWNGKIRPTGRIFHRDLMAAFPLTVSLQFMGDICHPDVLDAELQRALEYPAAYPQHRFFLLTKRVERLLEYQKAHPTPDGGGVLRSHNLWIVASIEDQPTADARLPLLKKLDAQTGVCYEPALGPLDMFRHWPAMCSGCGEMIADQRRILPPRHNQPFTHFPKDAPKGTICGPLVPCPRPEPGVASNLSRGEGQGEGGPAWVVMGSETGLEPRPFSVSWAEATLDFCELHHIPFYYKQGRDDLGAFGKLPMLHGRRWEEMPWDRRPAC